MQSYPNLDAESPCDVFPTPSAGPSQDMVERFAELRARERGVDCCVLDELTGPAKIGRYVFLERLGEGGMGVVVAAYDPKLDRKVAIKLIHDLRRDDSERRLRMVREAQAMAKLSHPNVVTVYEVGEFEGQLFLAMELVQGQNLRGWLARREETDDWRAVLRVFTQAGYGLAAAHRAGLVHRDFKPDNVLVGEDGRVRVGDFGLARREAEAVAKTVAMRAQAQAPVDATARGHQLTATGARMGTPAYMAPEQFEGEPTDARTDQFSFCVALWEALYDQRPFVGTSVTELNQNVTTGKRLPPPTGKHVPAWVRRVLERGMSLEPAERYPTTEAMLAALQADPTRARGAVAGVAAVAMAVAGWFGVQNYLEAREVAACEAEGASIAEVWNVEVQTKLRDGLLATGVPYAETTAEKVMPYLEAQAGAWRTARTEVCLDTRVRGKWDEDTLDHSLWCLDERRMALEARIAEFLAADATVVQNAVAAVAGLSPMGPCRDAKRLGRLPRIPYDQENILAVRKTLSQVDTLRETGKYKAGLDMAQLGLATAEKLGWPPLTAAAHFQIGYLLEVSGKYPAAEVALEDAYFQAEAVGALELAADAAVRLISIVGYHQARHNEGFRWSRHADGKLYLLGAGADSLLRAQALNSLAGVQLSAGAFDDANTNLERALQIKEKVMGRDHPSIADARNNLASINFLMGSYAEAKAHLEQALPIYEKALGPDHPDVARVLNNLANVYTFAGAYDEAKGLSERSLAIREKALGPYHPDVADALTNLANVYLRKGEHHGAKVRYVRAVAIYEKALGPYHPDVADALTNLANVYVFTGAYADARALIERGLAIREKALGPDHPDVAQSISNLASVCHSVGEYEDAKALNERALTIRQKVLGPEHPDVAASLNNLANVRVSMGAHEEAKALHEQALAITEKALGPEHPDVAASLNNLGNSYETQGEHEKAKALHARALAIREKAFGPEHPDVAQSLNNLGNSYESMGAHEEAKALFERGLAIREKALSPNHPDVASSLIGLARIALVQRQQADAVMLANRAVRVREAGNAPAEDLAESRFVLARALWDAPAGQGRDHDRASALARQARDAFRKVKRNGKELAEAEAFLAKHGGAP
jgi:tetratricopeptide (TPR) repeat protein/tRNA A-37 threonylcarbamoyl transferase component Bud32